jgi:hypothetical protein
MASDARGYRSPHRLGTAPRRDRTRAPHSSPPELEGFRSVVKNVIRTADRSIQKGVVGQNSEAGTVVVSREAWSEIRTALLGLRSLVV